MHNVFLGATFESDQDYKMNLLILLYENINFILKGFYNANYARDLIERKNISKILTIEGFNFIKYNLI